MTRRTMNLMGVLFCLGTAALLVLMAVTGLGDVPIDSGTLTQISPELLDSPG